MLKIVQNKLPVEFDGVIVEIPVNNMSTSSALKLNDFMKARKSIIEEMKSALTVPENATAEELAKFNEQSEQKNRLLNQMMTDLYRICIKDYDSYIQFVEQIPLEMTEQFINELIAAMVGTDKKKQIPTESESSKSKTGLDSSKRASRKGK